MEKRLIPQLRFPEFSDNWIAKKLNNLGIVVNGLTYSPNDIDDKGVLVLRSSNIQNNQLTFEDNVYVKSNDFNEVLEDDILICVRNGSKRLIGKNVLIPKTIEGVAFGAFMSVYRSKYNKFIFQLFATETYQKTIYENLGATINSINNSEIKKFQFNFPSILEQQKIAAFLGDIDDNIIKLTKKKDLLEQYKKGIMQKIFSQELRFKDDAGNEFPKWSFKKLGKISNITTGSSNRQDSGLDGEFTFFDRSEDIRTSSRYLFDGEAIIVAGEGSDFIPKYFVGKFDLHQRTYAIMNFKDSVSKYLYYYIHFHRNYFLSQAVGSTVKSLRLPMFQKMPIKLPVIEEQLKIANFLSDIDIKIEALNTKIESSKAFKKGLLQKMFI